MKVTAQGHNYQVCHQYSVSHWNYRDLFNGFNKRVVCHQCFVKGEYPIDFFLSTEISSLCYEE